MLFQEPGVPGSILIVVMAPPGPVKASPTGDLRSALDRTFTY
jgi:hypothetical protein